MPTEHATPDFLEIEAPARHDRRRIRPKRLSVLLIEDSESDAGLMAAYLRETETAYHIDLASSLATGKFQLQTRHYDAVLLDLNLPDSTGLATFEQIRAEFPAVPVIILTSLDDRNLAASAVRAGAQDYVPKSQADGEALDRAIRYARERTRRRTAERQLQHIQYELAAARRIQQFLFPRRPLQVAGFDIAGQCRPTAATGGDFFDVFSVADGKLGLSVADVSSHGLGPALIMAETRRLVRTLAQAQVDPSEVLTVVNGALMEDSPDDVFVTLFFAVLDIQSRALRYGSAGHEAYVLAPAGQVKALSSTGFPLGVVANANFSRVVQHKLSPGEILVLLTDGFREAHGRSGSRFGIEQTLAVVHEVRRKPAQEILEILFEVIFTYCRPNLPHDDLTAVIVKVQ